MKTVKINEHVYSIGVNDRETQLFENMWPIPHGISYNSFVICDEKTVLIDTVKVTRVDTFVDNLKSIIGDRPLDYLVVHHMEPDHSSAIKTIIDLYPDVTLIGNKKTVDFLDNYYSVTDNIKVVEDGETVSFGETSLTFYMTPMVHWPESMVSFEEKYGILFSQDAFGGYGVLNGGVFDDEVNFESVHKEEMIRYYVNIIGKFSAQVERAINKLAPLDIKMICPDHGIIWREDPSVVVDLYTDLCTHKKKDGVVIVYGTMYGHTEQMADLIGRALSDAGVKEVLTFDVSKADLSVVMTEIWKHKGLIVGSCTYNNDIFPPMRDLTERLLAQKMKNTVAGVFGSYSWSGGAVKGLKEFVEKAKYDVAEPVVEFKGYFTEEDEAQAIEMAKAVAKKVLED